MARSPATQTMVLEQKAPQAGRISHAAYPAIEQFQTIDGLLKSHASESDQKPLICYPVQGASDFEEHSAADLDWATDATVAYYLEQGLKPAVRSNCA